MRAARYFLVDELLAPPLEPELLLFVALPSVPLPPLAPIVPPGGVLLPVKPLWPAEVPLPWLSRPLPPPLIVLPELPMPLEPCRPEPGLPPLPVVEDASFCPWPPLRLARQLLNSSENFL